MAHKQTVVALFARREDADDAITRLIASGVRPDRIGYLEPVDEGELKDPAKGAAEGIAVGGASGVVLGGVLAATVGLIPGIGPALIGGILLQVLIGVVGGGATGAVAGGLLGVEASSEKDLYFVEEVQSGRILVSVEVDRDETEATILLSASRALEVDRLGTATLHARLHHPPDASAMRSPRSATDL